MLGIWLQDLAVWETILSGDSKDTLEAPHMEGVEPAPLPHVGAPHLTAIKDGVESAVLVGTELVDHCQHFIPHISLLRQSAFSSLLSSYGSSENLYVANYQPWVGKVMILVILMRGRADIPHVIIVCLVFFWPIVSPKCLQASVKWSPGLCRASSLWVECCIISKQLLCDNTNVILVLKA